MLDPDNLPRTSWRRRVLVLLLAVATAVSIFMTLILKPGDPKHPLPEVPTGPQRCKPGQTKDCVGGKAEVILVPASASLQR